MSSLTERTRALHIIHQVLLIAHTNFHSNIVGIPPARTFQACLLSPIKAARFLHKHNIRLDDDADFASIISDHNMKDMLTYLRQYIKTKLVKPAMAVAVLGYAFATHLCSKQFISIQYRRANCNIPKILLSSLNCVPFAWFVSFPSIADNLSLNQYFSLDVVAHCGFTFHNDKITACVYGTNSRAQSQATLIARQAQVFDFLHNNTTLDVSNILHDLELFNIDTIWPAINSYFIAHAPLHGLLIQDPLFKRFMFALEGLSQADGKLLWKLVSFLHLQHFTKANHTTTTTTTTTANGLLFYAPDLVTAQQLISILLQPLLQGNVASGNFETGIFDNDLHLRTIMQTMLQCIQYLPVRARHHTHATRVLLLNGRLNLSSGVHLLFKQTTSSNTQQCIILPGATQTDPIVGYIVLITLQQLAAVLSADPLMHSTIHFLRNHTM